ncbi:MAG: Fe-S cluster assembly transcriptional regulator IscR [Gammaproteobacteria bacterium]|nr:MAG: Fe-S cluster assembly transcriptional regulator IscR [Gammaproteobacteria bacterium]
MRLTTKGRYAVTAMLDLALHAGEGPVALVEISQRQGISLSYLEQLFARLRRNGLVRSTRGPGGGYQLARDGEAISVADVITAVDENVDATRCGGAGNCQGDTPCITHYLWQGLSEQIYQFLDGISLHDLVEQNLAREDAPPAEQIVHAIGDRRGRLRK